MDSNFNKIWQEHIYPLRNQTVSTATGNINIITDITDEYLERKSSGGKLSRIKKEYFATCYKDLQKEKILSRAQINNSYGKRCSSIVVAVLGKCVPGIKLNLKPTINLELDN